MCGIAGIYSSKNEARPEWVKLMTDTLKHRGPDDEGFLAADAKTGKIYYNLTGDESKIKGRPINAFNIPANLLLGHRRLSIIDTTSAGHQPMGNAGGNIYIIFNGEIYNYLELRKALKSLGYQFRTNTDTEVLLACYEEWGKDCLSKLNGMWSFCIYDSKKNILFCARDRFGVKPFYYYIDENYFSFASEIKAIVKLPFYKKDINRQAAFGYLFLGREETNEESFFKGIYELLPSHYLIYNLNSAKSTRTRYYTLNYTDEWKDFNENNLNTYTDEVKSRLFEAVKLRLRSDVPVGSCLSGGLDSSGIVCIINEFLRKEHPRQIGDFQKVFTAVYPDSPVDESRWAKIAVDETRTEWFRTYPNGEDLLKDLEDLVYAQDIPFGSTSIYAQYKVMKLASESGVKVLLDGQGGDELFTGYSEYYGTFFADMVKNKKFLQLLKEFGSLSNSPVNKLYVIKYLIKLFAYEITSGIGTGFSKNLYRQYKYIIGTGRYIDPDFYNENKIYVEDTKVVFKSLNQMLYLLITGLNLKTLLKYEDRNSMRFSVESRTPFADDIELIESVFKIPSSYKIHGGWSKFIFREAMRGILPEEIRSRKDKIGFATPEGIWLKKHKSTFLNYLKEDGLRKFIRTDMLIKDWNKLIDGLSDNQVAGIWRFINFAVWYKIFFRS